MRDGKWYEDPHAPAPDERDVHWAVVGPGMLPDKTLLFFEVDARRPLYSNGMTRPEFGALMLRFGVTDGFALDSGGSATMVARMPGDDKASLATAPPTTTGNAGSPTDCSCTAARPCPRWSTACALPRLPRPSPQLRPDPRQGERCPAA